MRLNAVYEDGDSFRHHVDLKRYGINPTAAILAGPDTRIDLSYEYFHDRRTADRGVPANGDEPLKGHHANLLRRSRRQLRQGRRQPRHRRGRARFRRGPDASATGRCSAIIDKFYQNIYRQPASTPATGLVALGAYNNRNDRQNLFSQTDLVWENRLGGIDQTLLVGFEVGREKSRNMRMTGSFVRTATRCRSATRRSMPT